MKRWIFCLFFGLCVLTEIRADEGMWLVHSIDRALEKRMLERGLRLSAREIYNEEAGGLADAVVSLGFACSGSFVSDDGLVLTNHHCAYADVAALSAPEHNYLEDGFWAQTRSDEIPLPNQSVSVLKRVLDVTEEAEALRRELLAAGQAAGNRRLSALLEKKYEDESGLEAGFVRMWSGKESYICLYKTYTDVRLVAAPPVTVASFGGDEDNWEWPQHKADFALFRVYENGVPLHPSRRLRISRDGYGEGDFAMVLGYPGRTDRYAPAAEIQQKLQVERPAENALHARQMEIVRRWMDRDPAIRMKYANAFFGLSNTAELLEGEAAAARRFHILEQRRAQEARMTEDQALLARIDREYATLSATELQKVYYRECLVRGLFCAPVLLRVSHAGRADQARERLLQGLSQIDARVEQELLALSVQTFFERMDRSFFKPIHRELQERFGTDYPAMARWLWENSVLAQAGVLPDAAVAAACDPARLADDPLCRYLRELSMAELNARERTSAALLPELKREYVLARYRFLEREGIPQYPDANSTLRLSFGRVCSYEPADGVYAHWQSTARGLREKYDPARYDFAWPDAFAAALPPPDFPLNFLTDLDITGGNSGSPVLNARGELIGLAFDGNKESLSARYQPVDGYNLCICVDIRYVLHLLRHYAPALEKEML